MEAQLSHREAKSLFLAALDEDLAEPDELRLRAHLDECGDCSAGFGRYQQVVKRVQRVERAPAPAGLSKMIMRRVRKRRIFGQRAAANSHVYYRVPVEAIIPVLLGVLVAAFLVLLAP